MFLNIVNVEKFSLDNIWQPDIIDVRVRMNSFDEIANCFPRKVKNQALFSKKQKVYLLHPKESCRKARYLNFLLPRFIDILKICNHNVI